MCPVAATLLDLLLRDAWRGMWVSCAVASALKLSKEMSFVTTPPPAPRWRCQVRTVQQGPPTQVLPLRLQMSQTTAGKTARKEADFGLPSSRPSVCRHRTASLMVCSVAKPCSVLGSCSAARSTGYRVTRTMNLCCGDTTQRALSGAYE